MSRNEPILLHRCFDPSRFSYEGPAGVAEIKAKIEDALAAGIDVKVPLTKEEQIVAVKMKVSFVRFPTSGCTCTERISLRERNKMLMHGAAVIVLRDGAPSADKFSWKEIVAVPHRVPPLHPTTAGKRQIEHGAAFCSRLTDAKLKTLQKGKRSELESLIARQKTASLDEMPDLSERMTELTLLLQEIPAHVNEHNRIEAYEKASGTVKASRLRRVHIFGDPGGRPGLSADAHLVKPPK